jgi:outer membrane protein TolC
LTLLTSATAIAQPHSLRTDSLSLSEAISLALQENHSITIAQNQANIDANNATIGNAGYLPTVIATGNYSQSFENTRLNFAGDTTAATEQNNNSNQLNAAVTAQYTIFDGFGNRYRLQSLRRQADLGSIQSRLQVENTLLQVIERYLQVIGQIKLTNINRESVTISKERFERAQQQYQMGGRTKVNLLNAEVALNQDSVRYVESQANLREAKRNLLVLLGQQPSGEINVESQIPIDEDLSLQKVLQSAINNNASLVSSQLQNKLAELSLQQSRSNRYPQLNAEASYSYTRSESEASLLTFQETNGLTAGLSLQFNIFNGFQRTIDIQNAQIELKNSREQRRRAKKNLQRDVRNAYETYSTNLFLLDKQELNVRTAQLNFERTKQAFELGQVSNTDFREAQLNLLQARQELISLQINAKVSEVELLQLSGSLISEENR